MSAGGRDSGEPDRRRVDAQLLADLWAFRAVARTGGMSTAAVELNVTAGAVSQRVLRLESRLEKKLFERRNGRLVLTESGSIMLDAMGTVSLALNNALERVNDSQRSLIVVSCGQSLAIEWLMPSLPDFYRESPGIELLVRSEAATPTAAWMAQENVDVRIQYGHRRPSDLVESAVLQEFTFPVCSPGYRDWLNGLPAQERGVVAMHDTDAWREGEAPRAEWQEWLNHAGTACAFLVRSDRQFNQALLAYQAAMYGQGIALARAISANALIKQYKLVPALRLPPMPSAYYRLLTRSEPAPHSPIARFSAWMARALKQTQMETLQLVAADTG